MIVNYTNLYKIALQVLQYLMDDVSDFLSTHFADPEARKIEEKGCAHTLKVFIDYITLRESENFRSRRRENQNSITLTTIHQVIIEAFSRTYYLLPEVSCFLRPQKVEVHFGSFPCTTAKVVG